MDPDRYRASEQRLFTDAGISPAEHWITVRPGLRSRVLDYGEGAPAVFLHGGPNAAAIWTYVAASANGIRCLLLDRPGCGLSEPPPNAPDVRTLAAYVSQLTVDVLDALELPGASLVGASIGGYSALRTAADHPDRISRIVLAGCPPFVPGWRPPGVFTVLRTPVLGQLFLAMPASSFGVRMFLRQMGHGRALEANLIPRSMLDWILAWQRDTDTMDNEAALVRAIGHWRHGTDPSLDLTTAELQAIETPCLILAGTDDPVGGEDVIDPLATALPAGTADYLPDAGHLPWLDDPHWFAGRLHHFLTADA